MIRHQIILTSLILLALLAPIHQTAQAQDVTEFFIYRGSNSLVIYVPGNQVVSLRDLTLEMASPYGRNERVNRRLQDFPAFEAIDFSAIPTPSCFRLERAGADAPLPEEVCAGVPEERVYVQALADEDVFWVDSEAYGYNRAILVMRGLVVYSQCTYEMRECLASYLPPPPSSDDENAPERPHPIVLIADFDQSLAPTPVEIARRLERDLQTRLRESNLDDVDVRVVPVVADEEEAAAMLAQEGASAIIWGWYDSLGISVRIFLAADGAGAEELPALGEVPLQAGGDPDTELAMVVRDVLPDNVSFISLYVVGHLHFMANEYQAGRAAFDAAMENMPANASFENEAILHFFRAREIVESGSDDYVTAICEYTQAIELDPEFAEAYNNLGVLLGSLSGVSFGEDVYACLDSIGTDTSGVGYIQTALDIQPDFAIAQYNALALQWQVGDVYLDDDTVANVEALRERDPSIFGTHIMLGNLRLEQGDLDGAIEAYAAGVALRPDLVGLWVNLGQAYLGNGDLDRAQQTFETALETDPGNLEAYLALANVAYQRGENEQALAYLDEIPAWDADALANPSRLAQVSAHMLRALVYAEMGETVQAIETVKPLLLLYEGDGFDSGYSRLAIYLAGLLSAQLGDNELIGSVIWSMSPMYFLPSYNSEYQFLKNNTLTLAWLDLIAQCSTDDDSYDTFYDENLDVSTWGTAANPCLPADLSERISAVADVFQDNLASRLYYQRGSWIEMGGAACPHVFTYDAARGAWLRDTVILYKLVGPASEIEQPRPLDRFDGRAWIRELEPETSYLDRVYVIVVDGNGQTHHLEADIAALQAADGDYLVLDQGEQVMLTFAGYAAIPDAQDTWIVAEGYYMPY